MLSTLIFFCDSFCIFKHITHIQDIFIVKRNRKIDTIPIGYDNAQDHAKDEALGSPNSQDVRGDRCRTRRRQKDSFHIHESLLPRWVAAAQRARRHSSPSVSIYAIANCHHRWNFESRALRFHSDECKTELQFRNWKREDGDMPIVMPRSNGNNSRKIRYFFVFVTSSAQYLNKSLDWFMILW